jgi:hypothetical protein
MKRSLARVLFPALSLLLLAGCGSYDPGAMPAGGGEASMLASLGLSTLLALIFAACLGFLYSEKLWSNAVRLVNIVTAALLAMNFFEPAAEWLARRSDTMHSYNALWDFLTIWGLFVLFFLVFREITDRISRVDVRFLKLADRIGSGVLAAWIGWVMVGFSLTTLHTAPLAEHFFFGAFQPGEKMFFGILAPDLEWLAFTRKVSRGAYCQSAGEEEPGGGGFPDEFPRTQAERRAKLAAYLDKTGALRVDPNAPPPPAPPPAP